MDQHAKILFGVAALFNFLAGLPMLVALPVVTLLVGERPIALDPLFVHLFGVLVLTFGWGYWRVSCDPGANRAIVHMGIVGKLLVVVAVYYDWATGNTGWPFALVATSDGVFAMLFADYLRRRPVLAF